jgi:hypothetical protein
MINYQECFKYYRQLLNVCEEESLQSLINWYQDKCRFYNDKTNYYIEGVINEIRFSKHLARWTSNFVIPKYIDIMIKDYTESIKIDSTMLWWYQDKCRYYLDEVK